MLTKTNHVFEIGSGTGQHAVYFAKNMPHLTWHTSDVQENHEAIELWRKESGVKNIIKPIALKITVDKCPELKVDAVFSANTVHIMSQREAKVTLQIAAELLKPNGIFILYGPFNYNDQYTSDSNAEFDIWLKKRNPESCIKGFENLNLWAEDNKLFLINDYAMPVNNRILVWKKNN